MIEISRSAGEKGNSFSAWSFIKLSISASGRDSGIGTDKLKA
jgi:hypothetical protein